MTTDTMEYQMPVHADSEAMKKYGLSENDNPSVMEAANMLLAPSELSVMQFGKGLADFSASYADKMLSIVSAKDINVAGKELKEIINTAQSLNFDGLCFERSKVPFVGTIIDKFRLRFSQTLAEFNNAKESIDETAKQLEIVRQSLVERNSDLEEGHQHIRKEYHQLGIHICGGKVAQQRLETQIEDRLKTVSGGMEAQELADMKNVAAKLEKRITDLTILQENALTSLRAIRLVQSNNNLLVDKYETISTLTIPMWKRQMMIGLSLEEQAQAVQLANKVDDFTNAMLKHQADLLHTNTLATAKANQRLVIDVDTIQYVQEKLFSTVDQTLKIQSEASKKLKEEESKILALRAKLENRMIDNQSVH